MLKRFLKRLLKNERGLTLIELLAVIVILGIVGAIAVPSIGNIIENSRRDAHVANARMMVDATRLAITSGVEITGNNFTLGELQTAGFLGDIQIPGEDADYDETNSLIALSNGPNFTYTITLTSAANAEPFIDGVTLDALDRGSVDLDQDGDADGEN